VILRPEQKSCIQDLSKGETPGINAKAIAFGTKAKATVNSERIRFYKSTLWLNNKIKELLT